MRKINLSKFTLATSLTARDINGRIVLNMIRTHHPVSRADVARLTGLQRSTVSLIADDLIEAGWVIDGEYGKLPRGRRPIFLQLNGDSAWIIGVNIQRFKTNVAIGNLEGLLIKQIDIPTDPVYSQFIESLATVIREFKSENANGTISGVGVCIPGRVLSTNKRVSLVRGLEWRDCDIKGDLEERLEIPVEIEDTANAVALAESYFGKKKQGYNNLAALIVDEEVRTGIITHGNLMRGETGMAGEFGHVKIRDGGAKCWCGLEGCMDSIVSNAAVIGKWKELKGQEFAPEKDSFNYGTILEKYRQNDPEATAIMDEVADGLGAGLAAITRALEPRIILVVGDITDVWDLLVPRIEQVLQSQLPMPVQVRIVPAKKNVGTRLCGAFALTLHRYLGAPEVA